MEENRKTTFHDNESSIYPEAESEKIARLLNGNDPDYPLTEPIVTYRELGDWLGVSEFFLRKHARQEIKHVYVSNETRALVEDSLLAKRLVKSKIALYGEDVNRWFNENSTASRKTIALPLTPYIRDYSAFLRDFEAFKEKDYSKAMEMAEERLLRAHMDETGNYIMDHHVLNTGKHREYEEYVLEKFSFNLVRDHHLLRRMKDFNLSQEKIYKKAFKDGMIRILLKGERVFYYSPLSHESAGKTTGFKNTVPYGFYLDNLKRLNND